MPRRTAFSLAESPQHDDGYPARTPPVSTADVLSGHTCAPHESNADRSSIATAEVSPVAGADGRARLPADVMETLTALWEEILIADFMRRHRR